MPRCGDQRAVRDRFQRHAFVQSPELVLRGAPARERARLRRAEDLQQPSAELRFHGLRQRSIQRSRRGNDQRRFRKLLRRFDQCAQMHRSADEHARRRQLAERASDIRGEQRTCGMHGHARDQRQQHAELHSVRVLRRNGRHNPHGRVVDDAESGANHAGVARAAAVHAAPILRVALRSSGTAGREADRRDLRGRNLRLDRCRTLRRGHRCFDSLIFAAIAAAMRGCDFLHDLLSARRRQQRRVADAQCGGVGCEKSIAILAEIDHRGAGRERARDASDIAHEFAKSDLSAVAPCDRTRDIRRCEQRQMGQHKPPLTAMTCRVT